MKMIPIFSDLYPPSHLSGICPKDPAVAPPFPGPHNQLCSQTLNPGYTTSEKWQRSHTYYCSGGRNKTHFQRNRGADRSNPLLWVRHCEQNGFSAAAVTSLRYVFVVVFVLSVILDTRKCLHEVFVEQWVRNLQLFSLSHNNSRVNRYQW